MSAWPFYGFRGHHEGLEFLADAQKLHVEIDPTSGEATQAVVASILTAPKPLLADVQAALGGAAK
jgi:hypothetical protein